MARPQVLFALLVLAQAMHSVEEYAGRLWESFPPARLASGLVSANREFGFVVINVGLVAFGIWCLAWPMRRHGAFLPLFAWTWVVIETINGLGHPLWSLLEGGYTPGVATAPLLLVLALALSRALRRAAGPTPLPT